MPPARIVSTADAAGVEHALVAAAQVELLVRVTAHDHRLAGAREHRREPPRGRRARDPLVVVPWRAMAEQHRAEAVDLQRDRLLERGEVVAVRAVDLPDGPQHRPHHLVVALGRRTA
jgi:hypothetical protein